MFTTKALAFAIVSIFLKNVMAINEEQKAQIQAKFVEVGTECLKEHAVTIDDLTSFRNKIFPDSENAGCFAACIFNKVGLFDDKGALSHITTLENAKKVFEDQDELDSIEEFLTTCATVNDEEVSDGEKGCDRAKLAFECFANNYEKFGFNIDF